MSRQVKAEAVTIEARRALVADLVAKRTPYRQIAERLQVSFGTVAGDVEALRKDWRKSYGQLETVFDDQVMTLDALQAQLMGNIGSLSAEDLPATANALRSVVAEKSKMLGLYPKLGADTEPMPTGPITLELHVIEGGNRRLVTNSMEHDAQGNSIFATEQARLASLATPHMSLLPPDDDDELALEGE